MCWRRLACMPPRLMPRLHLSLLEHTGAKSNHGKVHHPNCRGWDLMNEPRCSDPAICSPSSAPTLIDTWVAEQAAFVKSKDRCGGQGELPHARCSGCELCAAQWEQMMAAFVPTRKCHSVCVNLLRSSLHRLPVLQQAPPDRGH